MQHSTKAASFPRKPDTGQGNHATLLSCLATMVQCAAREQQMTAVNCELPPAQTTRVSVAWRKPSVVKRKAGWQGGRVQASAQNLR